MSSRGGWRRRGRARSSAPEVKPAGRALDRSWRSPRRRRGAARRRLRRLHRSCSRRSSTRRDVGPFQSGRRRRAHAPVVLSELDHNEISLFDESRKGGSALGRVNPVAPSRQFRSQLESGHRCPFRSANSAHRAAFRDRPLRAGSLRPPSCRPSHPVGSVPENLFTLAARKRSFPVLDAKRRPGLVLEKAAQHTARSGRDVRNDRRSRRLASATRTARVLLSPASCATSAARRSASGSLMLRAMVERYQDVRCPPRSLLRCVAVCRRGRSPSASCATTSPVSCARPRRAPSSPSPSAAGRWRGWGHPTRAPFAA